MWPKKKLKPITCLLLPPSSFPLFLFFPLFPLSLFLTCPPHWDISVLPYPQGPGIQEMLNKHVCVERTKEQNNSGRITLTWNFPGSYEKNMISATLRSQCFALSDLTPINTPVFAFLFISLWVSYGSQLMKLTLGLLGQPTTKTIFPNQKSHHISPNPVGLGG